jgi:hypothetical protein
VVQERQLALCSDFMASNFWSKWISLITWRDREKYKWLLTNVQSCSWMKFYCLKTCSWPFLEGWLTKLRNNMMIWSFRSIKGMPRNASYVRIRWNQVSLTKTRKILLTKLEGKNRNNKKKLFLWARLAIKTFLDSSQLKILSELLIKLFLAHFFRTSRNINTSKITQLLNVRSSIDMSINLRQ